MNDVIESKDTATYPYNYRGVVMDRNDPLQRGRVRVKVYPMFAGVDVVDVLPWAAPATSLFEGAGVDSGAFEPPAVGTKVWVFFEAGHIMQPVYFASAPDGVSGVPAEAVTSYPSRKVWKTASGVTVIIDDSTHEIKISQPTGGAFITLTADGKFMIGNLTADLVGTLKQLVDDLVSYYQPVPSGPAVGAVLYNPAFAADLVVLQTLLLALKGA